MSKLEQAAQQALEALESYSKSDYIKKQHPKRRANGEKAIIALREALAEQAEQEPVDYVLPCPFCGDNKPTVFEGSTFRWRVAVCNNCGAYAPEVRHDTLAEDQKQAGIESDAAAITAWNTRAAPVRTKDLTDDEIRDAFYSCGFGAIVVDGCRAVIAADREKNK